MNNNDLSERERRHLSLLYPYLSECTLFLARDDSFPLKNPCSIVCYGRGVRHTIKGGSGSGDVNARFFVTIEEGLEKAGFTIANKEQLDIFDKEYIEQRKVWIKKIKSDAKKERILAPIYAIGKSLSEVAYDVPVIEGKDAAIYVVSRYSGEGSDREVVKGDILLTDYEIKTIKELNTKYKKFMLVINAGGIVDLSPVQEVRNILVLSELGTQIGDVFSDILLGKSNPSGKLAATWANIRDYPYSTEIPYDDTPYNEGIFVGYRFFDTFKKKPLYPFGYGLSYTDFKLDNFKVSQKGNNFSITLDIHNIGKIKGKEVVQVYVTPLIGNINTPYQELVGFNKSKDIEPGKSEKVTVDFSLKYIAKYDENYSNYYLPKGAYIVRIGNSSINTVEVAVINVKEDIIIKKCVKIFKNVANKELYYFNKGEKPSDLPEFNLKQSDFSIVVGKEKELIIPEDIKNLGIEELATINNGLVESQSKLSFAGETSITAPGAAGEISNVFTKYFKRKVVMADGPAGIRLTPRYYKKKEKIVKLEYNAFLISAIEFFPRPFKWLINKIINKKFHSDKNQEIFYQYCTALPVSTAIAQSFDTRLALTCGDIVGSEMEEFHIDLWLAPAMNIQRTIMCGRNEYFSEDPYLSGVMASYLTRAVQSHKGKGVTLKHFAANNQETRRTTSNSVVNESTLREIYLRGFEICLDEAHPQAVMSSYNLINGVHASENYELIHDYLFVENSYEGVVMTDWVFRGAQIKDTKYSISDSPAVYKTHTSLFMPGSRYHIKQIIKDVRSHPENRVILEKNATRLYNNFADIPAINAEKEKLAALEDSLTPNRENKKKEKKINPKKLKYRTKDTDIKYRGPFSYRHLRLFAWFFMAVAQLAWIIPLAGKMDPSISNTVPDWESVLSILSNLPLPLFLLANFGIILRRREDFRWLLTFYGGIMILLYILGNVVVIHYIWGFFNAVMPGTSLWEVALATGDMLSGLGNIGYIFNLFVDLFLCVLTVFFLFYKPKRYFQGKHIAWFRAMVIIPLIYEITSLVIKQCAMFELFSVPSFFFFLLTSKPPLTFLAFFVITIIMKVREVKFLKKFNNNERLLEEHYSTNAHSLRTSITISVVFLIVAILDIIALSSYVIIHFVNAYYSGDPMLELDPIFVLFDGISLAQKTGIGGSVVLILAIPFVLLFSYTRTHKNTKIDSFIPIIGIGLVVFTVFEGLYLTLRTAGADLMDKIFELIIGGGGGEEPLLPDEGGDEFTPIEEAVKVVKDIIPHK